MYGRSYAVCLSLYNVQETDELQNITYTLVFQLNDRSSVLLNDLILKAKPPRSGAKPNGSYEGFNTRLMQR